MAFGGPPKPVPPPHAEAFATGLTILNPLSRRGTGPGVIVVVDDVAAGVRIENGVPSPLTKWAEESYTVVEITAKAFDGSADPLKAAAEKLNASTVCEPKGKVGLVSYSSALWKSIQSSPTLASDIAAAVLYSDSASAQGIEAVSVPLLAHLSGSTGITHSKPATDLKIYNYAEQTSPAFATPSGSEFNYSAEAVSHTRNLTFLKKIMGGPYFDLETLWEEHTYYEFEDRNVEHTMNTMVEEPYVNHVPTITGGIGRKELTDFYTNHFIFSNPEGTALELISRTVGIDRVVDEFIFKLNHNKTVDWLLPGVPPTHKDLAIPMMAVVNLRGDRLYHEHITWDQATALRQAGLLPEYLPFAGADSSQEVRLPVAGVEAVEKMRDKNAVPSNVMFGYAVRTAGK